MYLSLSLYIYIYILAVDRSLSVLSVVRSMCVRVFAVVTSSIYVLCLITYSYVSYLCSCLFHCYYVLFNVLPNLLVMFISSVIMSYSINCPFMLLLVCLCCSIIYVRSS